MRRFKRKKRKITESPLKLIKRFAEFRPQDEINLVPGSRRGLYVLYLKRRKNGKEKFDVVYVGMTTSGMLSRLRSHKRKKGDLWTHFSAYEVWDNIRNEEIIELEGLFRHFYRKDSRASALNVHRRFRKLRTIRHNKLSEWVSKSRAD